MLVYQHNTVVVRGKIVKILSPDICIIRLYGTTDLYVRHRNHGDMVQVDRYVWIVGTLRSHTDNDNITLIAKLKFDGTEDFHIVTMEGTLLPKIINQDEDFVEYKIRQATIDQKHNKLYTVTYPVLYKPDYDVSQLLNKTISILGNLMPYNHKLCIRVLKSSTLTTFDIPDEVLVVGNSGDRKDK